MDQRVTIAVEGGIADVRLNRADKLNALDPAMFEGIEQALAELRAMPGLRAVVLSGEGRAFSAGLDMASMASGGASAGKTLTDRTHGLANIFQHVAWGWRELPVPVIAAVHGIAFGGGFQIMSGADIRIVHPEARLSIMEMKWGLVPDMAGVALWRTLRARFVGEGPWLFGRWSIADAFFTPVATRVRRHRLDLAAAGDSDGVAAAYAAALLAQPDFLAWERLAG